MAKTATLTTMEGYSVATGFYGDLADLVHRVLRGALDVSKRGDKIVYKDLWSEAKVVLVPEGDTVSKIKISSWTSIDGVQTYAPVVTLVFEDEQPLLSDMRGAFNAYHETNGATDNALTPLADYVPTFISEDVAPSSGPWWPIGHFKGTDHDDTFIFNDFGGTVEASAGSDRIRGGAGFEEVDYYGVTDALTLTEGSNGRVFVAKGTTGERDVLINVDSLYAGSGDDDLRAGLGDGDTSLFGGSGNDVIGGGGGNDRLSGGDGDDVILGRGGQDYIFGGRGADRLDGGRGNDILFATYAGGFNDQAADVLIGGGGKDLFGLSRPTVASTTTVTILDFQDGTDFIGLTASDREYGFDDLVITALGDHTLISDATADIAVLRNVAPEDIDRSDFVEALDYNDYGPLTGIDYMIWD